MRKLILLLLCLCLSLQCFAADFEITEDYEVKVNKESLLSALLEADISSVRKALDLKLITCRELTTYYLERIQAYNETFQCFITLCDDALAVADQRDEALRNGSASGTLFGIPVVIKDNIDYEGYLTTNGLNGGNVATKNASVVQYLLDEGAVILGKTNMSAGAEDALRSLNDMGLETFNAYNPNLASGGSSGGSAVAVSLNFAMASLGTDTNSSLRYPSALNGCVSLRTTFGLIDRQGCVSLNPSRDTVGAITRSVMDQAIMLDVLTNHTYQFAANLNVNVLDGLRIGVLTELSYPIAGSSSRGAKDVDSEIQSAFANAISELEACGAEIITVSLPNVLSDISNNSPGLYRRLEKLIEDNQLSAVIYPAHLHTPHYTTQEYLNGKSIYDLPYSTNCNALSSRTGAPEITVPIGQHSRGAGIGMEIISLKNQDQLLLDIAYSYTEKHDHRVPPKTAPSLHFGENAYTLDEFLDAYQSECTLAKELQYNDEHGISDENDTINQSEQAADEPENESNEIVLKEEEDNPLIGLCVICLMGGAIYLLRRKKETSDV